MLLQDVGGDVRQDTGRHVRRRPHQGPRSHPCLLDHQDRRHDPRITFSQTLGTALGDWAADTGGLGYGDGALVFGAGLVLLAALYYWTDISRVFLFWAAFILTRPLGATVGDFLDKPIHDGGLHLSRPLASAVIAAFIIGCILILPQRAGMHPASVRVSSEGGE